MFGIKFHFRGIEVIWALAQSPIGIYGTLRVNGKSRILRITHKLIHCIIHLCKVVVASLVESVQVDNQWQLAGAFFIYIGAE